MNKKWALAAGSAVILVATVVLIVIFTTGKANHPKVKHAVKKPNSFTTKIQLTASTCTTRTPKLSQKTATLCLINAERKKRKIKPLTNNRQLATAAQSHARDMAAHNYFSHDSLNGTTFAQRIHKAGYRGLTLGENIAYGTGDESSPTAIVTQWMNSPGHRVNILRKQFSQSGIGIARSDDGTAYYVNDFGHP